TARFVTYGRGMWDLHLGKAPNTGIASQEINKIKIELYPNPANNIIHISIPNNLDKTYMIEIRDAAGKTIYTELCNTNLGIENKSIDISQFAKGVYFVSIYMNSELVASKPFEIVK
ncbi:MAG: T9SS type A sorting domain-containing protein, partial [Bacteroidetes bacterium]|nr:T9SS type A sorting domain-containing protein [Bacteroidota bacterium]